MQKNDVISFVFFIFESKPVVLIPKQVSNDILYHAL